MDLLNIENQLCFPLYALSRLVTAHYKPLLAGLDLTYPQYLVLLLLWQHQQLSAKEIGDKLMLDSGTLTPLLKRLEDKKVLKRRRSREDERLLIVSLTEKGTKMKAEAEQIPKQIQASLNLSNEEITALRLQVSELVSRTKQVITNNK